MPASQGKRKSIKKAAQRQAARRSTVKEGSSKRASAKGDAPKRLPAKGAQAKRSSVAQAKRVRPGKIILAAIAIVALVAIGVFAGVALYAQSDSAKYAACEKFRPVVEQACQDCGLDPDWTDCLLAAMVVESGGDENVSSVLGVDADIMQAAEGAYGWVVTDGWPDHGIEAQTTTASIYAGALEFKQNLELWEDYLGPITPNDTTEIQLVIQGYNYGADGWLAWCRSRGVRAYTVSLAQEYSDTRMPENAKGTPTHAQKWLTAYNAIRKS